MRKLLQKMGLASKGRPKNQSIEEEKVFSTEEINFLLTKLRSATYTGAEFEAFHKIWTKLLSLKK